jgi:hypothetical protein
MTEIPSEAYLAGYFFGRDAARAPLRPSRSNRLRIPSPREAADSQCSEGHCMHGLMMCPHAVALEQEAQTSAPPMAFHNDSARARQASRSAR